MVYLLKLLDDPGVNAFDGDTTYRRVEGEMNEWELTVFAKIVLRGTSRLRHHSSQTLRGVPSGNRSSGLH